MQLLVCKK